VAVETVESKDRTRRPLRRVAYVVTALALLAGCGGDEQKSAAPKKTAEAKTPTAAIPKELTGTWVRTFKQREVEADGFEPGTYVMRLKSDGALEMYFNPGNHDVNADCLGQEWCDALTATAKGSTLTISETTTCSATGDYSFTVDGDKLATKKVKDECTSGRPTILGNRTWTRQQ
jgi:hypothetical protein